MIILVPDRFTDRETISLMFSSDIRKGARQRKLANIDSLLIVDLEYSCKFRVQLSTALAVSQVDMIMTNKANLQISGWSIFVDDYFKFEFKKYVPQKSIK